MLVDHKLKSESFVGKNVKALPDNPSQAGITAAQLKDAFDKSGETVIATSLNAVIDILSGGEGAANIGTVGGSTVQAELDKANELISQKISADNVLTKDNVLPYSPLAPYNPATKLFVEQSMSAAGQGTAVVIMSKDAEIPIPDRVPNTFYYKVTDTQSGGGISDSIKVSPNMGLKMPLTRSKSGIDFD